MIKIEHYLKPLAQLAATIISAIVAASLSGPLGPVGWTNIAITGFGAFGVLAAGNLPAGVWSHAKAYVSGATALLVLLQTLLQTHAHPDTSQWLQFAVAALGTLGVHSVKGPVVEPVQVRRGKHEARD